MYLNLILFKKSPKRWFRKKLQMQGAQTRYRAARRAAPTFCNDEVEAQRRRWIFYGTIKLIQEVLHVHSYGKKGSDRAEMAFS